MDAVDQPLRQPFASFGKGVDAYWTWMVDASQKGYGIIRVSAIAILLDAARNSFTVSLSAHDKTPRPVSVYKEIYLWLYWTRAIVDAGA